MADVVHSIGATGRDFSTIDLWVAAVEAGTGFAAGDVAIGECYDDADFADVNLLVTSASAVALAAVKLTAAAGHAHDGSANTGVRLLRTTNTATPTLRLNPLGSGSHVLTVEDLEIDGAGYRTNTSVVSADAQTTGRVSTLNRLLVHGFTTTDASVCLIRGISRDVLVQNCIVYDLVATASGRTTFGLYIDADRSEGGVLNNTAYKIVGDGAGQGVGIRIGSDDIDGNVRNNISAGHGGTSPLAFQWAGATNVTSSNNLSDDATADDGGGSNHVINAALADLFVSITAGMEDLRLKAGSPAIDAGVDLGTTPTSVNIAVGGRDRDAEGDVWDIGAYEYVSADISEGSGTAALSLSAVGVGEHVASGEGTAALSLSAVGVGEHVASGDGTAALSLSAVGVGEHVASGDGTAALSLSAVGVGEHVASGDGTAALSLSAVGVGEHLASGSASAGLLLGAVGVGETPAVDVSEGTGIAALTLSAVATGEHVASGDATAGLTLDVQVEGRHVAEGAATAVLTLGATGVGEAPAVGISEGTGTAALTISVVAEGVSVRSADGTAALTLNAEAEGRAVHSGSSDAALTLTATGVGETPALGVSDGSGVAALTLSVVATGEHIASGDSEAALALGATGEGFTPAVAPSEGFSVVGLTLSAEGAGEVLAEGQAVAALALSAEGDGLLDVEGSGEAGLVLTVIGLGASVERIWYLQINPDQAPFSLGFDEGGRYQYAFNVTALKAPSTTLEEELKHHISLGFDEPIYIGSKAVSKGTAIHLIKTPSARGLYVQGRTHPKIARSSCQVVVKSNSASVADTLSRELHLYLANVANEEIEVPEWAS